MYLSNNVSRIAYSLYALLMSYVSLNLLHYEHHLNVWNKIINYSIISTVDLVGSLIGESIIVNKKVFISTF